jgi:hypothetical protein
MALTTTLSNAAASLAADAVLATLDSGFCDIYDGTQPAGPDTAVTTQVKLARLALYTTAFAAAVNGVAAAHTIATDASANATGTATWCRFVTAAGVAVFDGSVGTSGCNLNLDNVAIVATGPVAVTACTYTQAKVQ